MAASASDLPSTPRASPPAERDSASRGRQRVEGGRRSSRASHQPTPILVHRAHINLVVRSKSSPRRAAGQALIHATCTRHRRHAPSMPPRASTHHVPVSRPPPRRRPMCWVTSSEDASWACNGFRVFRVCARVPTSAGVMGSANTARNCANVRGRCIAAGDPVSWSRPSPFGKACSRRFR